MDEDAIRTSDLGSKLRDLSSANPEALPAKKGLQHAFKCYDKRRFHHRLNAPNQQLDFQNRSVNTQSPSQCQFHLTLIPTTTPTLGKSVSNLWEIRSFTPISIIDLQSAWPLSKTPTSSLQSRSCQCRFNGSVCWPRRSAETDLSCLGYSLCKTNCGRRMRATRH